MKVINIAGRSIGNSDYCFVIAEAGVNHNGRLELAMQLVDVAARAGADAIKFQTFHSERVISRYAAKARYQKESTGNSESQLEMVKRLELSDSDTKAISDYAASRNILFLSTAFDEASVDLLNSLHMPVFKVGSGDITHLPLLEYIGSKRKPVILSTGMSTLDEVRIAIQTLQESGCPEIALLHCISSYPAPLCEANLRAMNTLRHEFDMPIGFSDHTIGIELAVAAASLGAVILEKHITLDKTLDGPDQRISLTPEELTRLVEVIRWVESALGNGVKRPTAHEEDVRNVARRSIVAARAISSGTVIAREMIEFKRPGTGLAPGLWRTVVGKTAKHDISEDEPILPGDLA